MSDAKRKDPLRQTAARSYNGALLRSAEELAPAGMVIEIYESIEPPLFNEDILETFYRWATRMLNRALIPR